MKTKEHTGRGILIGNAGEYYVMAELLKRGAIAALAPRNTPAYDILATFGDETVRIRVKTKSEESPGWQWNAKQDGTIFIDLHDDEDFTVLVNLTADTAKLQYYILLTKKIYDCLSEDWTKWMQKPGLNGRSHDPNNRLRVLKTNFYREKLIEYLDKWETLWDKRNF